MSTLYAVVGAGGCGRGVMPLARAQLERLEIKNYQLVFVDDALAGQNVNGQRVLNHKQFMSESATTRYAVVAIANPRTRERMVSRCEASGVLAWSVKASNVVCMDNVSIGAGAILSPFVCITSNIKVGKHFHANLYSYVEHDCVIGNYVTFAPSVMCNGNVHIEDYVYIGAGAVIKQGSPSDPLVIGRGAVVGMGAVVTKSVPPGVTVVGNPAKRLINK
jgi:sugar O-acyltransferase (sialic acid O-acetyltransferase NeuD family)